MGLKFKWVLNDNVVVLELKSDQNGVEIYICVLRAYAKKRLKSDQNGVEINS